ncbi:4-carboxymuconolactone decarboxylase [Pacificibacter maritimus]|uniref:4-carboxymuconolactone decarboxylase n=1 Tax=Pacificibacter maritimus TaxID=762213 RepID=A0A3N4UUE0_9RHOB|nr:carboxymuconolactone decarboxylase family protein [Pacificibacter maritimus]RPE71099.1 4-carboxymuconolactone decarboxylase [Pacificibacter maritimus]
MNDFKKLFEDMTAQGQKMAEAFNPALKDFEMPKLDKLFPTLSKDQMDMLWGTKLNPEGLDAKTRLLVVLAGQTVLGVQAEAPFKAVLRNALKAGATQQQIGETITQMSMLGGLPAMSKALGLAAEVFAEKQEDSA